MRLRCGRHKGLIATWLAIHWLITLYSTREDHVFGVREIAQEAGVGRNELSGPSGHIQRLLALGLIQIVGYKVVKRTLPRCPVYHIDLAGLERQSITAMEELLRARGLPAPPRPAPDPRQLDLFGYVDVESTTTAGDAAGRADAEGRPPQGPARTSPRSTPPEPRTSLIGPEAGQARGTATPVAGAGDGCPVPGHSDDGLPGNGTVSRALSEGCAGSGPAAPENGTVTGSPGQGRPGIGTATPGIGAAAHLIGAAQGVHALAMPEIGTVRALDRDMDGQRDREIEGAIAHTPGSLLTLATAAARTAILEVLQQLPTHVPGTIIPAPAIPEPPDGETRLPAPVLDLWGADRPAVLERDRFQLEQLAAATDRATGGHGAYWLGRAILMAEACLEPRGQRPTVAYLRALLRRWQREGSWGSDLAEDEGAEAPTSPRSPLPAPAAPTTTAHADHPAVQAYRSAFGRAPNAVQAQEIAATVGDLAAWQRVLTEWQANGWKEGGVAKMLDRYRKETSTPADGGPPPSIAVIHTYPNLTAEQRERWIRRFHAAATPAEKRAVIARLEQEHPQ